MTDPKAADIAAMATGLRADQIARAVVEYRKAVAELHEEPAWAAIYHASGKNQGFAQYGAEGTKVVLSIESYKSNGWQQEKSYLYKSKRYETFGEARAVELAETTRPTPYAVPLQTEKPRADP